MTNLLSEFEIDGKKISDKDKTYFIADVAANHDGDIERAKDLIYLAVESGADAAKFQHFEADTIVSDYGFKALGDQMSHQKKWKKSVYQVYEEASINLSWTEILHETCKKAGISFFTSPYSIKLVDLVDEYVPAYKIGSGDITWLEIMEFIANKNKPVLLATGASTIQDVQDAVNAISKYNGKIGLMQCNTNYTGSLENFKYINLNVLNVYRAMFPGMVLGLSDHTPGHATVLGAVALGARIIEKHFTDNCNREGPDHAFSMTPQTWRDMVDRVRELELSMGTGVKKIEENEKQTVVLQRRSIRAKNDIEEGMVISKSDLDVLRPCPEDAIPPKYIDQIVGSKAYKTVKKGQHLSWKDLV